MRIIGVNIVLGGVFYCRITEMFAGMTMFAIITKHGPLYHITISAVKKKVMMGLSLLKVIMGKITDFIVKKTYVISICYKAKS